MQATTSSAWRLSKVLKFIPRAVCQWRNYTDFSGRTPCLSGIARPNCAPMAQDYHRYISMQRAFCSSVATTAEDTPTETAKDLYDKMLESAKVKRTMPPNAWLWSMMRKCENQDDIQLLFGILYELRIFRASNLRILENYNTHLCQEITRACLRAGALEFAKKSIWIHNIFGLTPTMGACHQLLSYAEDQNDTKLMVEVFRLMKRNGLPLQPGTADIIFRICYKANNWKLMWIYSKKYILGGVKLRQTSFDILMDFASRRGDVENLWKYEQARSKAMKEHTLVTGFSCAKGLLKERKPEEAAAMIQALNQNLPDKKKSEFMNEIQKLFNEWPLEVIKRQKQELRKDLAASLLSDIPTMVSSLLNIGIEVSINMNDLSESLNDEELYTQKMLYV